MHLAPHWARRLLKLARTEPSTGSPISTLELFFAAVRGPEDVDSHGRRTLRRGVL